MVLPSPFRDFTACAGKVTMNLMSLGFLQSISKHLFSTHAGRYLTVFVSFSLGGDEGTAKGIQRECLPK